MRQLCRLLCLASIPASIATAQISLGGPVAGFVADTRIGAVRPLLGIPGASRLGGPLPLPFTVTRAAFASSAPAAVAISDDGKVYLLRHLDTIPEAIPQATLSGPDAVFINADGSLALVYSSSNAALQFLGAAGGVPAAYEPMWGIEGRLLGAAVEPGSGCAWIARAATAGDSSRVDRICAGRPGEITPAPAGADLAISAISSLPRDGGALVTDRASGRVLLFTWLSGTVEVREIAGSSQGVAGPVAARLLASGELLIANREGREVLVADSGSGEVLRRVPLPGAAAFLDALGNSALLCSAPGSPLVLIDLLRQDQAFLVPEEN